MVQFQWLRRLVRRHTTPIPSEEAEFWKQRLSIAYMIIAWNALGVVGYCVYQGKANWAAYHGLPQEPGTPAQQWSKTLGIKNATVYRVTGFSVDKYEVHNEFDDKTHEPVKSTIVRE